MLSRGIKIIIVIILSFAIIGILIYFFIVKMNLLSKKPFSVSDSESPAPTVVEEKIEEKTVTIEPPKVTEEEIAAIEVKNLALMFTERFGTFSNTNDFSDLDDLQPMMTKSFASWVNSSYKKKLQSEYNHNTSYINVTTEALAVNFEKQTSSLAEVMVTTRRVKEVVGGDSQTFFQKLKLEFIKQNNQWLVNSAYWQN